MTPHEFIVKNVREQLEKEGYSFHVANTAAQDALEYYKTTGSFKRHAIDECIKHAKKKAKELGKK